MLLFAQFINITLTIRRDCMVIKKIIVATAIMGFVVHNACAMEEVRKGFQEFLKKNPKTLIFFGTFKNATNREERLGYISPIDNIDNIFKRGRFGNSEFGFQRDEIDQALEADNYMSCKFSSGEEALLLYPYDKNAEKIADIFKRAEDLYKYQKSLWSFGVSSHIVPFTEDDKCKCETEWWWERTQ